MKIYYAPEFARQVEQASPRHQNIVKLVSAFIERNEWNQIISHPRIQVQKLHDQRLYSVRLEELRILASLENDARGQYWIFAQLDWNR